MGLVLETGYNVPENGIEGNTSDCKLKLRSDIHIVSEIGEKRCPLQFVHDFNVVPFLDARQGTRSKVGLPLILGSPSM